jgi:hypothetical protein
MEIIFPAIDDRRASYRDEPAERDDDPEGLLVVERPRHQLRQRATMLVVLADNTSQETQANAISTPDARVCRGSGDTSPHTRTPGVFMLLQALISPPSFQLRQLTGLIRMQFIHRTFTIYNTNIYLKVVRPPSPEVDGCLADGAHPPLVGLSPPLGVQEREHHPLHRHTRDQR